MLFYEQNTNFYLTKKATVQQTPGLNHKLFIHFQKSRQKLSYPISLTLTEEAGNQYTISYAGCGNENNR